ncbi:MAG: hypothetical protein QM796_03645 [Chthoniobacteraceae bacterium]
MSTIVGGLTAVYPSLAGGISLLVAAILLGSVFRRQHEISAE